MVRILAGLVGLAIVLPVLIWGGAIGVELVAAFALVVGLFEYTRMALSDAPPAARWGTGILGATLFFSFLHAPGAASLVVALAVLAAFLLVMALVKAAHGAVDLLGRILCGALYLGALLPWVVMVRRLDEGLVWLFVLLGITWLGDTGAYFVGRTVGRHRMAPLLSPKKTWEGTAGGIVASMVTAVVIGRIGQVGAETWVLLVVGAAAAAAGVLGDLAESLVKRTFGVKDSGGIMPGHGGILDRIDSLLFSAPVLYLGVSLLT